MMVEFITASGAAACSILKASFYITPRKKWYYIPFWALMIICLLMYGCLQGETQRFCYCICFPAVFGLLTIKFFCEPAFCKLYNVFVQCVLTSAVFCLADGIFEYHGWKWAGMILAFHILWCVAMYSLRKRKFTFMPLDESSYRTGTMVCAVLYLILLVSLSGRVQQWLAEAVRHSAPAVISTLVLFGVVLLVIGFLHFREEMAYRQILSMINRQNAVMKDYAASLEHYDRLIHILEHDKHHFVEMLRNYLQNGDVELALELLNRKEADQDMDKRYCRDSMINAILTDTFRRCEHMGTAFRATVRLPEEVLIDSVDLATLLMNILNNAVECCQKLADCGKKPVIELELYLSGGFFAVRCRNTVETPPNITDGYIVSTKREDGREHGLGIASIRMITEKYGGKLELSCESGYFLIVSVMENKRE